jgi:hypothetical protein
MNSLRPEVQDILAGKKGASSAIRDGLTQLMEAGYPTQDLPMGAQTVICRQNLEETADNVDLASRTWNYTLFRNVDFAGQG